MNWEGVLTLKNTMETWLLEIPVLASGFPLSFSWQGFSDFLLNFAFFYPLFMAYLWMIGACIYFFHWERNEGRGPEEVPDLSEYPPVSIIVPCHNEARSIEESVEALMDQRYPEYEVLVVDDGSNDNTLAIVKKLLPRYPRLRLIHLPHNQGKAMALSAGALISRYEFLICIDGDALLAPEATTWIMKHFVGSPRVGAVTGNPRVRTRSTLLGRIQVGEFSAIIGLIKRAQRIYGRVFTVSGVVSAFRKSALHHVGYWSNDMVTEDIDISWKMQLNHWDIRFEPNALCWILMPETYSGLWRQRLRWAQGGVEVLLRYWRDLFLWRKRRMWPVYFEYFTSLCWSYVMVGTFFLWTLGQFVTLPSYLHIASILPGWNGVLLGITCLLQFALSLILDSRYEKGIFKNYFWIIWYPLVYWLINVLTMVVAVPKTVLSSRQRARWISPDRGLQ